MKKKVIALACTVGLLFSGVVGASSINGEFNGNPIVKVKSNGQVLPVEDTPAVIYEGRTLVPIYMLRQLGAEVNWDQDTYSVDVKLPSTNTSSSNQNDIKLLKLYSKIVDQYKSLTVLGDMLSDIGQAFSNTYDAISNNYKVSESFTEANNHLNTVIETYNAMIPVVENIINESNSKNLNVYDMRTILNDYNKSIDYYKESYKGLEKYNTTKREADFYDYLNNSKKAFDSMVVSRTNTISKYYEYFNKIQDF
ncbi:stalk domain-containing protein [Paenibacillus contaminans]|nr:stalk domain-containing protein [Paenibacillus contaminans]